MPHFKYVRQMVSARSFRISVRSTSTSQRVALKAENSFKLSRRLQTAMFYAFRLCSSGPLEYYLLSLVGILSHLMGELGVSLQLLSRIESPSIQLFGSCTHGWCQKARRVRPAAHPVRSKMGLTRPRKHSKEFDCHPLRRSGAPYINSSTNRSLRYGPFCTTPSV
ncbi:hypothetical protein M413DRAFT_123377 [Hebeloma cylindrosporum]|uniref:Uncharacterized protein n=1 Tax=Hebeloma cylindrosporum TaxID=76867 RepID=A0A0C2XYR9_HEBCY|nr:hypothetical protein M413DRAFT_123377 [Hebeloma cylindrosporum h7]